MSQTLEFASQYRKQNDNDLDASSRDFATPAFLTKLMHQLKSEISLAEEYLKRVENGNTAAYLQGQLAGYESLINVLFDSGYKNFILDTQEEPSIFGKTEDGMKIVCDDCNDIYFLQDLAVQANALLASSSYKQFLNNLRERIEIKKDWLFTDASKGRDLHFTHGWAESIKKIDVWANFIVNEYSLRLGQIEREKKEMLPF